MLLDPFIHEFEAFPALRNERAKEWKDMTHVLPNAYSDINPLLFCTLGQSHGLIIHNFMLTHNNTERWQSFKITVHYQYYTMQSQKYDIICARAENEK